MNSITESRFRDLVKLGAVKSVLIEETEPGRYRVTVKLTTEDVFIETTRRTVSLWANLDRLARRLRDIHGDKPLKYTLSLLPFSSTSKETQA